MSAEYILFLAKLREKKRKAFYEWASTDLSSKLFLTCRSNFNHYKSVHHLIPTQNKSENSPFNWVSRSYVFFWVNVKRRGKSFLQDALWDYPQEQVVVISDEKVSPFGKSEIFLPLLCFLLDALTIKHWRTWSSMINLWIEPRTCQK